MQPHVLCNNLVSIQENTQENTKLVHINLPDFFATYKFLLAQNNRKNKLKLYDIKSA